ncbi:hypothetical protein CRP01_17910 [Flavilitoribacter nigricans DSM 23189 = NBRC 102662]|uniref:HYR domain-containing protein n=2 Tax=Flavilitoribacter TaxID=2762562 RepID=A0A2D0NAH5_FLAN2|nr:hypothetical protein CRP01_17910 [Flavilitoribacter nigricans DSM 23189 = NBRC 102662]
MVASPVSQFIFRGCPNNFTEVRTWTFSDTCGNSTSVSQTIHVLDDQVPIIIDMTPPDLTLSCNEDYPAPEGLTAIDNCDGIIIASPVVQITSGDCPNEFTEVRIWTFRDTCGNTLSTSQTIHVLDDEAPVIQESLPPDLVLACAEDVPAPASLTAIDNCDGKVTAILFEEINLGDCAHDFTLMRTWTFSDACGNTSTHQQTIQVLDDIPPFADCPPSPAAPIEWSADFNTVPVPSNTPQDPSIDPTLTGFPSNVSDNCISAPSVAYQDDIEFFGPCNTPGQLIWRVTRTWTIEDNCGNVTACVQVFDFIDTTPPNLGCKTNTPPLTLSLEGSASITPETIVSTVSDNCGNVDLSISKALFNCSDVGNNTVVLTAVDECGNTSNCSATIRVVSADADGDGVADCDDNCQLTPNPNQADQDKDGIGNVCDDCNNNQGGGQCDDGDPCTINDTLNAQCQCVGQEIDSDGDDVLDGCDICLGDDASGDSDGDGICDDIDTCPDGDDNIDSDGDGVADACDLCLGNDLTGDADQDGICDELDICPDGDDNLDTDGDMVPDACDQCPGANDSVDTDGDGICNELDICQGSDDHIDTDLDGVPDGCDQCPGEDDRIDDNNNGIPDACEQNCEDLFVSIGNCQTVYNGYAPAACTDLTATVSGGVMPFSYSWSTGETTEKIEVCPASSTLYSVTVVDAEGCDAVNEVSVEVINVACGKNGKNVALCNNGQPICVRKNDVPALLAAGATLGPCGSVPCSEAASRNLLGNGNAGSGESSFKRPRDFTVYPNPARTELNVRLTDFLGQDVSILIYNRLGTVILLHRIAEVQTGIERLKLGELPPDAYLIRLKTEELVITKKFVVIRN